VVTAYADDITIYVTSPADISHLDEIISRYERASGSKINKSKSKVMALGTWNKSVDVLGMQYHDKIKIHGLTVTNTVHQSSEESWKQTT
jgi:hypothetical protein